MRSSEIEYWDSVASNLVEGDGRMRDNWNKRELLNRFLSKISWNGKKVLEIGVGCGVSAGALRVSLGGNWTYIGTELSPIFIKSARNSFGLNVIQADILSLPAGPFDRIVALDSLEHINPEDRMDGYKDIVDRMNDEALLVINMPVNRSAHSRDFDHGFDLRDIAVFEDMGLSLQKYELYEHWLHDVRKLSAFVILLK